MYAKHHRMCARTQLAKSLLGIGFTFFSVLAQAAVVFQENFDSGLGQFTASGNVTTGTFGARMNAVFGSGDGAIVSNPISTVGFSNLSLSFTRATSGLDSGEAGIAEFSTNGSTYTVIESIRTASGAVTFNLPATAANQSALRLRFRVNASTSSENYTVDTIVLNGTTGTDPGPGTGFQRGPDPTNAALVASTGPFTVASSVVSSTAANGYGGGTIYYPTGTTEGPFAAIAVVPGYLAAQSSIQSWGPRLASWGFVVITISTNSTTDQPASRATQLVAALNQVVSFSNTGGHVIAGKVDGTRRGVMGWSMGGGGTLIALQNNPTTLKAGVPLAPWNSSTTDFSSVRQPVLILGCESDTTAPVSSHALPFYNSMPSTNDKAYGEINNGGHSCANNPANQSGIVGKYGVSWMKRFLDDDERFSPFLCGAPHQTDLSGTTFSRYLETCPY